LVEITKVETGGIPFLKKTSITEQGIKVLTIKTEPKPVETEYEGKKQTKLECICETQVLDPKEVKWQMNATTQNYLIDQYGSKTEDWIGKQIEIAIKQSGSAAAGIYPKGCSLEKVIA
jgi:hypothetical protein